MVRMEGPPVKARNPLAARVLFALCALLLAAAGIVYAWLFLFSNFQLYDDEGYFLVLVRHLLDGHRIYDEVSTVYGPGWLGYRWLLNGVLGVPLTTDGVRMQTLVAWIVCALLVGLQVRSCTRGRALSSWFALAAGAFALLHLSAFANEPGHPQDFAQLVLLGGLALFVALREQRPRAAWIVLGIAVGLQGWTKVNLGVFLALPALLLCLSGTWNVLVLAAVVALPWVLMRTHLAQPWAPALALVAGCGLVAAWSFRGAGERRRELLALCGGIAVATLACLGFALARGSTLAGLWHALVVLPSRFTTEIVIGIRVPASASFVAPLALALALLARKFAARFPSWLVPALELCFGAFVLYSLQPHPEWLIPYALPCAWIVLLREETRAARLPLVLCAPLQALQVFPVSGSQEALGTILLVPLAAIALADACAHSWRTMRLPVRELAAAGVLVYVGILLVQDTPALRARWNDELERVALPGAHWTRFDEITGGRARFLADTLRGSFDGFLGVRGDSSQYAWTGISPATGVIVSHSWRLFDERQQQELAAAYERAPRALVLDNLNPERIAPELRKTLPFFQMLARAYRPIAQNGSDLLCVRLGSPAPRLASCVVLPGSELRVQLPRLDVHWPAAVEGPELERVQVVNLQLGLMFADSSEPRFVARLFDGDELLFDGSTHARVSLERIAAARELRLELPQPLPRDKAPFCSVRFFGADGRRVLSLPVVIALRGS